jgi:hypothetical protein
MLVLVLRPEYKEPVSISVAQSAYIIVAMLDKMFKGIAGELMAYLTTNDLLTYGQELIQLFV